MGLENVDEKRFSVEEAVAAAGTDCGKAPTISSGQAMIPCLPR
jgi:hypothetical protein